MFSGCEELLHQLDLFNNLIGTPISSVTAIVDAAFLAGSSQEKENFRLETHDVAVADVPKIFPTFHSISIITLAQRKDCLKPLLERKFPK